MLQLAAAVDALLDRTVVPGYTRIGPAVRRRLPTWPDDPAPGSMAGKRALVTGASSGLGIATAEGLAALGAEVVLVVRDLDKAAGVVDEIRGRHARAKLDVARCDLADLDDVRRFADAVTGPVDVLVHNAGVMPPERTESPQGHELSMAVHVLGPVLMTELMRERGVFRDGRVVLVTSGGMYTQRLRDDDPEYLQGDYKPPTAYARSKRAQVELLPVLSRRWPDLAVHATHPGWADTPGVVDSLPAFHKLTGPLLRDAAGGADTTVWVAAAQPAPPGGRLWHDRAPRPTQLLRKTRTGDAERERLWAWVAEAIAVGE